MGASYPVAASYQRLRFVLTSTQRNPCANSIARASTGRLVIALSVHTIDDF